MIEHEAISKSWKMMQIGLVVRNMDQAVNQLSMLGFGPFGRKLLPPNSIHWETVPAPGEIDVKAAMIGNVELELCCPLSGESPHMEFLKTKGEGVQHVLFAVDDLKKEVDRLTEKGAKVILGIDFGEKGGLAYVDLNTCGFVIELIEIPEEGIPPLEYDNK